MGEVVVKLKVMPDSPDADMDRILSGVEKVCKVEKHEIQPVAFGLKALIVYTIIPDKGGTDDLEERISDVESVQSVEVVDVRRAL